MVAAKPYKTLLGCLPTDECQSDECECTLEPPSCFILRNVIGLGGCATCNRIQTFPFLSYINAKTRRLTIASVASSSAWVRASAPKERARSNNIVFEKSRR